MPFMREIRALLSATVVTVAAACDDPLKLAPASLSNVIDTVTLYALRGTDVRLPSGYDLPTMRATRTDLSSFDFAFDIADNGQSLIYPAGALHLDRSPGVLPVQQLFDSVTSAPTSGYLDSLPLGIAAGTVFVVRSRPSFTGCQLAGSLPRYGKFLVLTIDSLQRSIMMEALVDQNCGYHSLLPGAPTA
jgi:hypothetical protein